MAGVENKRSITPNWDLKIITQWDQGQTIQVFWFYNKTQLIVNECAGRKMGGNGSMGKTILQVDAGKSY